MVDVPIGINTITLTVSDGVLDDTDEVVVTVDDGRPYYCGDGFVEPWEDCDRVFGKGVGPPVLSCNGTPCPDWRLRRWERVHGRHMRFSDEHVRERSHRRLLPCRRWRKLQPRRGLRS
jgi:hypothetical protein